MEINVENDGGLASKLSLSRKVHGHAALEASRRKASELEVLLGLELLAVELQCGFWQSQSTIYADLSLRN